MCRDARHVLLWLLSLPISSIAWDSPYTPKTPCSASLVYLGADPFLRDPQMVHDCLAGRWEGAKPRTVWSPENTMLECRAVCPLPPGMGSDPTVFSGYGA